MPESVTIRVPATTANLGPGFDALGMALTLYNQLTVQRSDELRLEVAGEGLGELPDDASNIIVTAMQRVFDDCGVAMPPMHVHSTNAIPLSRGLGSSAAARVGAMAAARALCKLQVSDQRLLALATELEGHPDNVAAALRGGLVACCVGDDGAVTHVKLSPKEPPAVVVLIPDVPLETERARQALPDSYPKADVSFNLGHACVTLAALLLGHHHHLPAAMVDRVHEPHRAPLMPWFDDCCRAAREAGALAAVLSGAGTTILALTEEAPDAVGEAMLSALRSHGHRGRVLPLKIDADGATVLTSA